LFYKNIRINLQPSVITFYEDINSWERAGNKYNILSDILVMKPRNQYMNLRVVVEREISAKIRKIKARTVVGDIENSILVKYFMVFESKELTMEFIRDLKNEYGDVSYPDIMLDEWLLSKKKNTPDFIRDRGPGNYVYLLEISITIVNPEVGEGKLLGIYHLPGDLDILTGNCKKFSGIVLQSGNVLSIRPYLDNDLPYELRKYEYFMLLNTDTRLIHQGYYSFFEKMIQKKVLIDGANTYYVWGDDKLIGYVHYNGGVIDGVIRDRKIPTTSFSTEDVETSVVVRYLDPSLTVDTKHRFFDLFTFLKDLKLKYSQPPLVRKPKDAFIKVRNLGQKEIEITELPIDTLEIEYDRVVYTKMEYMHLVALYGMEKYDKLVENDGILVYPLVVRMRHRIKNYENTLIQFHLPGHGVLLCQPFV